jgi:hypothetical protein
MEAIQTHPAMLRITLHSPMVVGDSTWASNWLPMMIG